MKIYTEVTIDMNPDSSCYGEHLSEESHEYNGDVALCGKPRHTLGGGERGRPSGMAAGLRQRGYKHPSVIGEDFGAGMGMIEQFSPVGKTIPGASSLPSASLQPEAITPGGQRLGGLPIKGNNPFAGILEAFQFSKAARGGKQRAAGIEDIISAYDQPFKESWYDPYMEKALAEPGSRIMDEALMELTPENVPGFPSGLAEAYGQPAFMHTGGATALATAGEDLTTAGEDYMAGMDELQTEEERIRTAKSEADKRTSFERGQFLREQPSAEEARQAAIAKTGMAYSGPAQRAATISRGKEAKTLRDITEAKREGQRTFEQGIEGVKAGREETYGGYEDAQRGFGESIMAAIEGGGSQIQDLLQFTRDLPFAHQEYGSRMQEGGDPTTKGGWYAYGGSPARFEDVVGQGYGGGYGAPQGGWFDEPATGVLGAGVPELQDARTMLKQAEDFAGWLGKSEITPGDIGGMMGVPEWSDPSGEVYTPGG